MNILVKVVMLSVVIYVFIKRNTVLWSKFTPLQIAFLTLRSKKAKQQSLFLYNTYSTNIKKLKIVYILRTSYELLIQRNDTLETKSNLNARLRNCSHSFRWQLHNIVPKITLLGCWTFPQTELTWHLLHNKFPIRFGKRRKDISHENTMRMWFI